MGMQEVLAFFIGVGLAATCGFRVFVPLLGMSIASLAGYLPLSSGFEWIGTWPALITFAIATIVEIGAYYIPWLDNLLDTIATPTAIIAGTIVTMSMLGDESPLLRWLLGIIAGGGVAGIVQLGSVLVRGTSTATTGGLGNPLVATGELAASVVGTILSILLPLVAVILVTIILAIIAWKWIRRRAQTA
jgi:hypothetical protein